MKPRSYALFFVRPDEASSVLEWQYSGRLRFDNRYSAEGFIDRTRKGLDKDLVRVYGDWEDPRKELPNGN